MLKKMISKAIFHVAILMLMIQLINTESCSGITCIRRNPKQKQTSSSQYNYRGRFSATPTEYRSRVKTSRYDDYIPLERYRNKYGSLIGQDFGKISSKNASSIVVVTGERPKNSSGLAIYSTLTDQRIVPNIIVPERTYPARTWGKIKEEGYGKSYLEWSEHGKGCSCDECGTSECHHYTGVCECHENVIGTKCTCREGFSVGVGCDPVTGQCSCLPGVIGDNCEGCPNRWVLIDGLGCQECDDCVHALLDTTDELRNLIYPVIQEYESAAQSFFLHQRLQVINDSIDELRPKVDVLDISDEELKPVQETLDGLFSEANALSTRGELLNGRSAGSASDGAKIDQAVKEAEHIVNQMKNVSFAKANDLVRLDFEVADEFLDRIRNLSSSGVENQIKIDDAVQHLKSLQEKITDMEGIISESNEKVYSIDGMNRKSKIYGLENLQKKLKEISDLGEKTKIRIDAAQNYTSLARTNLEEAEQIHYGIESELNSLRSASDRLNISVEEDQENYDLAIPPARDAITHTRSLYEMAEELDNLLADSRQVTESALRAANAYNNIVKAIEDGMKSALSAKNASEQALALSAGVSEDAKESFTESREKIHSQSLKSEKSKLRMNCCPACCGPK
ncbi:hypothetical protein Avbf_08459 [Armadillidium vulgare]|nr:hypothetical protein Avbf_08459 [Armadillidium vulgare]